MSIIVLIKLEKISKLINLTLHYKTIFMYIYLICRSEALPKQMFSVGNKQVTVVQTKSLALLSKRPLLTNSNTSERSSKKRKITSDNADFISIQTSDQV